ncbi:transporter [Undibacterium sp. Ren11W]|uniref:transporter n=1 Tax=Undibacterium sp. Ren11W TaxID=3413045 RepID=UPI003BF29A39
MSDLLKISKLVLLLGIISLPLQVLAADNDDAITPYRPSVSSPAQLPLAGQLELELGGLSSRSDEARRHSMPYQLKLAFSQEWGVLVGGELLVVANDGAGQVDRGYGDTSLVLKRAFIVDEQSAFGLELSAKAPTAVKALGSGSADYAINSIYSRDFGALHMDANLNLTRLGVAETDTSRMQTGLSSSFSTVLSEHWGITGEWSGSRRNGTKAQGLALFAFSYSPSKRMTMDIGVSKGLTTSSPDLALFAGIVLPVAKLW